MTQNIIIIIIIALFLVLGIRSCIKHFKGEGECCGGSSTVKRKRKHLDNVIAKKTVIVEGMTCEHCKNRVEESIDKIEGAAGIVHLKKKELIVSMERPVSEEEIRAAVEKAGYQVAEIR